MTGSRGMEYEISDLIWMRLYQKRHGLAAVLGTLEIVIGDYSGRFETDGRRLYLDTNRLQETFFQGSERLCLECLHMISHCLLCHPFVQRGGKEQKSTEELDWEAWELAEQLWGGPVPFLDGAREETDSRKRAGLLYVDDHERWRLTKDLERLAKASGDLGGRKGAGTSGTACLGKTGNWWRQQREQLLREHPGRKPKAGTQKQSRKFGRLVPASGHRGDYREILYQLSSFREDSRMNPEEFQLSWYLYGLEYYGNIPLVEPLEYREERKIEDLVIVIDTSASCERELVRIFLEETRGILEQEELFFRHFCLHILQCDNQIQKDDVIESREELENYLEHLELRGGGGTDFCPVFAYLDKLKQEGAFRDLKGILYFTDGCGLYPREEPDYAVYFVMMKGRYDAIDIPDWIHQLILEECTE